MGFLSKLNNSLKPSNLLKPQNAAKMLATGGLYAGSPQNLYDANKPNAQQTIGPGQNQGGMAQPTYATQQVRASDAGINPNNYYNQSFQGAN